MTMSKFETYPREDVIGRINRTKERTDNAEYRNLAVFLDNGNIVLFWKTMYDKYAETIEKLDAGTKIEFLNVEKKFNKFYKQDVYNFKSNSTMELLKSKASQTRPSGNFQVEGDATYIPAFEEETGIDYDSAAEILTRLVEPISYGSGSAYDLGNSTIPKHQAQPKQESLGSILTCPTKLTVRVSRSKNYNSIACELECELGPNSNFVKDFNLIYDKLAQEIDKKIQELN